MFRQHHGVDGHEFEQTPEDSEGQGSLACCSPWGHRVRHDSVTEQQQMAGNIFYSHLEEDMEKILVSLFFLQKWETRAR